MKRAITRSVGLGLLLLSGLLPAQERPSFKIVVNASNPTSSMPRAVAAKIFLKKISAWEDRRMILPVDQSAKSPVRQAFTEEIHGKKVANIKGYWRKMIFSGDAAPPPELASDSEVLSFVAANDDAIGYVSEKTPVGDEVKILEITD